MPRDGLEDDNLILPDLLELTRAALKPLLDWQAQAIEAVQSRVCAEGRVDAAALDAHQCAAHALAWMATYVQALEQMQGWAERLGAEDRFAETESLIHQIAFGEYLSQIKGGIPISQGEVARLSDIGIDVALDDPAILTLCQRGNTQATRARLAALVADNAHATAGASGLDDEMEMIRDQFRRFVQERITPHAHDWHLTDTLIPSEIIAEMAELGVFGLTIPEDNGGFGLSKTAMCVVSEELSRGWIGVGSLGTRSEIAAELILGGGTDAQKAHWLPLIASGEVLPTAVFTEPNTGSDLGALSTRAVKTGDGWSITGNKTWITHAARAGVMAVMARTDPDSSDYRGLSMFLAEKTPGTDSDPFPDPGITGGEIEVLGYRGMKEYELAFDGFAVAEDGLLGGAEGQGFKQLMRTFESARIQTAARAIGVAQSALDLSLSYAQERRQFGQQLLAFPRVAGKIAMMAVEITVARQLSYHAAREKDGGRRCDLEAGMAKLLAARVAWAAADNGVQIHGGNGFALEYPISRVLCDARILSIFEGAAEIQAQVIARRLLG
ncbi:MAG: acyl-CoA dehydrogenase [Rhodobacteraceae bacterium]|nr:acyl-CoA dehydrogenase [Paracoccaceae bacterium]